jgi:hypothetical protein
MKFRRSYIPIVLSVIVSSLVSAAPAPTCPSPAAACTSFPPATGDEKLIRLAQRPSPGGGGGGDVVTPPVEPSTPEQTASCALESFEGDVSIRDGDTWRDAVKGDKLKEGTEIHTGPDSKAVVRFSDGSFVIVNQMTETAVGSLSGPVDRPKIRMLLKMGEIAAKVNHEVDQEADFAIRTPDATASVRGTDFVVDYSRNDGASYIRVNEGEVLVTPANTSLRPLVVPAGGFVRVSTEAAGPIENAPAASSDVPSTAPACPHPLPFSGAPCS